MIISAFIALAFIFQNIGRVVFSVIAGCLLGIFCAGQINQDREVILENIGQEAVINATISEIPETKNSQTRLRLSDIYLNYSTKPLKSQIYVILAGESKTISRSDNITIRAVLQDGFGEYSASIYRPSIITINKPDPPDYSIRIRTSFSSRLRKIFHFSERAELALGFLIGEKALPSELKKQLKLVGLSHIVVASGFSLSILINFANKYMRKISRFVGFVSALFLIIAFLSITGLSPSLLRASLVSGLTLTASYFGRKFHPARLLIYVTAISLFINPSIITNLAWQLSFAAYAGIMLFSPLLKTYLYGRTQPGFVAEMIIITISAQLFCLPISIYNFGQFSIVGIVANILVTPAIPAVMLLSFLAGIMPLSLATVLYCIDDTILSYQISIIQQLSNLKWATMDITPHRPWIFVTYLLIVIIMYLLKKRTKYSYKPLPALDKSPKYGKIYTC